MNNFCLVPIKIYKLPQQRDREMRQTAKKKILSRVMGYIQNPLKIE